MIGGLIIVRTNNRNLVATIWETVGVIAIVMLIVLPNKMTIIDTIINNIGITQRMFGEISYATVILAGVFLFVYLSSFKIFPKERSTKLFSIVASALMAITIGSLIVFK